MFNPVGEFEQKSGADRPERKSPCSRCRAYITLRSPAETTCFACWAGWPPVTRPQRNLTSHPNYEKVSLALAARRLARQQALEAMAP